MVATSVPPADDALTRTFFITAPSGTITGRCAVWPGPISRVPAEAVSPAVSLHIVERLRLIVLLLAAPKYLYSPETLRSPPITSALPVTSRLPPNAVVPVVTVRPLPTVAGPDVVTALADTVSPINRFPRA